MVFASYCLLATGPTKAGMGGKGIAGSAIAEEECGGQQAG